jgi:hypothetical protein
MEHVDLNHARDMKDLESVTDAVSYRSPEPVRLG